MGKQIFFGGEALDKLVSGAKKLNDAVTITMGAKGQNVLLDINHGTLPHITKDGVTVAKSVELTDSVEDTACTLLKNIALRTNEEVGDGTTTSVALAYSILQNGAKAIKEDGVHPIMLKRGLDIQLEQVLNDLKKYTSPIEKIQDSYKVALVSANGDENVAKLVTEVYELVGRDGNIAIEASKNSIESTYEKVDGIKFDRGYNNPYYINTAKGHVDYNNAAVLICDYQINSANEIEKILEYSANTGKALLIICEDIDIEVEKFLIKNKLNGVIKPVVVKAPEFGDRRITFLEDIAVLTGGKFVSDLTGIALSEVTPEHLGSAARIILDENETSIIGGRGDRTNINELLANIKVKIENATDDYTKSYQEERYAKVNGGVVVIKVGAYSDVEKLELKDRIEDAVNAVKSSLIGGIIPGGGTPLFRIGDKGFKNSDLSKTSNDINKGRLILLNAIKAPFRKILSNAGVDVAEVEETIKNKSKNMVFDVVSETYKNALTHGIIDPVLVTKTALINAVSIAGTLLTTGCTINYENDGSTGVL